MLPSNGGVWGLGQPDCASAHRFCFSGRKLLEPGARNESHTVTLSPYMADTTFHSNVLVILAALLCAIVSVAGLLSMLRCALRCSRHMTGSEEPRHVTVRLANTGMKKAAVNALPSIVYGAGSELPEMTTDCPICLGEFAAGQCVRVLPRCNHGFHVRCIDTWLRAHSSCPSCRQSLLDLEEKTAKLAPTCHSEGNRTPESGRSAEAEGEPALADEMQKTSELDRGMPNAVAVQMAPSAPASPVDGADGTGL